MHGAATKGVTLNTEWELLTIKCALRWKELLTIINQIEHIYSTLKKKKNRDSKVDIHHPPKFSV